MSRFTLRAATAAVLVAGLGLAGCASTPSEPTEPTAPAAELNTITDGKLTVATGLPAYYPYVIDDAPETGQGFEAAVAYAIAEKLGFDKDDVVWVRATWDETLAPGPKPYDFNLQQVSITQDRKEFVDFAGPYYNSAQAVVTVESSKAAGATTLAALKEVRVGAASGTESLVHAQQTIAPTTPVQVFNNNDDLKLALQNGLVDAIVVDVPTAIYIAGVELDGGKLLGELPNSTSEEGWGVVLRKDSAATPFIQAAIDALRADGTLDKIAEEWVTSAAGGVLN